MSLLLVFARTYPRQTLLMFACLLFATIAEGVGLSSLLLQWRGSSSLLAISHQPALLEVADTVYLLESGAVKQIEQSTSRQLLSAGAT